jgi:hypothetical protein
MRAVQVILAGLALLGTGCVSMSPEQRLSHEIFLDAAGLCESRYHTLHVDQVDLDGNVKVHADADTRAEIRQFTACYHDSIKDRVDSLRKSGKTVPDLLTKEPDVELD